MRAWESTRERKSLPPATAAATRWAVWASRLVARRRRWVGADPLPLRFHVRTLRAPIVSHRRWLTFHADIRPRLTLSFDATNVWQPAPTNVYAPQLLFLQPPASARPRERKQEAARGATTPFAPGASPPPREERTAHRREDGVRPAAMTLAFARTRSEHVASVLHEHLTTRREAVLHELAERLTRRSRRVDEVAVVRAEMALRREAPPAPPAQGTRAGRWPEEGDAFERRGLAHAHALGAAAELNVEQLASQVLKQIDRRVIARRERMGQV